MSRMMTRDLTEGRPLKQIVSFALPLLFGVLFQQLYSFVDTAVVGRYLGAERLAAVGATGSVNFLVIGLCLGLCSGFSIPVAQAFGAKDEREIRRCVYHASVLSGILSILFAVLATVLCKPLLPLGDSRTPVVFLVIASLVNIVLDLFLIIVCGMDVAGAAVATAVSQLVSGIGCVVVMIRRFPVLHLRQEDSVP